MQTLPALVLGLWRSFAHRWALLAGWAAGHLAGLFMVYDTPNPAQGKEHFGGAQYALSNFGIDTDVTLYTGIIALALNLLIVVIGSFVLRALGAPDGEDVTRDEDYEAEPGDEGFKPLPATPQQEGGHGRLTGSGQPQAPGLFWQKSSNLLSGVPGAGFWSFSGLSGTVLCGGGVVWVGGGGVG